MDIMTSEQTYRHTRVNQKSRRQSLIDGMTDTIAADTGGSPKPNTPVSVSSITNIEKMYRQRVIDLESQLAKSFPLPPIGYVIKNNVKYGYVSDDKIIFNIPFRYAPISINGIKISNPERLVRNVRIQLAIEISKNKSTDRKIVSYILVNRDGSKFEHYHSFGSPYAINRPWDCCGLLLKENKFTVNEFDDILAFCNRVENLYSDISIDKGGDNNKIKPDGLPHLSDLRTEPSYTIWPTNGTQEVAIRTIGINSRVHEKVLAAREKQEERRAWDINNIPQSNTALARIFDAQDNIANSEDSHPANSQTDRQFLSPWSIGTVATDQPGISASVSTHNNTGRERPSMWRRIKDLFFINAPGIFIILIAAAIVAVIVVCERFGNIDADSSNQTPVQTPVSQNISYLQMHI